MTWNNFRKSIRGNGTIYGTKECEFGKIELLPQLVNSKLEVAVGGASPPVDRWRRVGWSVIDFDKSLAQQPSTAITSRVREESLA